MFARKWRKVVWKAIWAVGVMKIQDFFFSLSLSLYIYLYVGESIGNGWMHSQCVE